MSSLCAPLWIVDPGVETIWGKEGSVAMMYHFRIPEHGSPQPRVLRIMGGFCFSLISSLEGNPLLQIEVEPTSEVRIEGWKVAFA